MINSENSDAYLEVGHIHLISDLRIQIEDRHSRRPSSLIAMQSMHAAMLAVGGLPWRQLGCTCGSFCTSDEPHGVTPNGWSQAGQGAWMGAIDAGLPHPTPTCHPLGLGRNRTPQLWQNSAISVPEQQISTHQFHSFASQTDEALERAWLLLRIPPEPPILPPPLETSTMSGSRKRIKQG